MAHASGVALADSGLALPPSTGDVVRSLDLAGMVHGGLPPAAATLESAARAWRDGGGMFQFDRLAVSYGPLEANFVGTLGLDQALRPDGRGTVSTRGLGSMLEALGAAGVIPSHAAQAAGGVLGLLGGNAQGGVDIPVAVADGRLAIAGFAVARLPPIGWSPNVPAISNPANNNAAANAPTPDAAVPNGAP